jgi:rfaE bifunctional protein kinase chain/domain
MRRDGLEQGHIRSRAQLGKVRVLVAGDVMLDRYWYGHVDRISPEAPVPVIKVEREDQRLGGAANVARNVSSLGAGASLVGTIGDDEPGKVVEGLLRSSNIESRLVVQDAHPTTVKLRAIGRSQQLLRIDFEDPAPDKCLAMQEAVFVDCCAGYDVVVFSDYAKGALRDVHRLVEIARASRKPVLVDPKGTDYRPYRGATAITPNTSELRAVVGAWHDEAELERKAQDLRASLELDCIVLTRSEEGMTLFDRDGRLDVKAQAKEVFDVTGAGDTVVACLAVLVGAGATLREALPVANRAGGISVGRLGTTAVTYDELFA